jgi:hypothetical protein
MHAGRPSQATPLVQIADAARPDPPARWRIERLASEVVSSQPLGVAAHDSLARWFAEWLDLAPRVRAAANRSPLAGGAIPAADALASVGAIGLEALEARKSGVPPSRAWTDSARATLAAADKPQGTLHLVVVPAVLNLLTP